MGRVNLDSIQEYEQQYPQHTQSTADKRSAYYVALDVQRTQDALLEAEKERIAEENSEEGISIDELMADYAEEDKYKEYLVDEAALRCSMATLDDFQVPDGRIIKLKTGEGEKVETRVQTTLRVLENPMSVNGLKYATVKDTMINQNIFPFKCNCKLAADRGEEVDKIIADKDCNSHGVCRHLMDLNEEWDNMLFDGVSYLKRVWAAPRGVAGIIGLDSKIMTEEAEGITMTSVLFCRHGGLIYPVTSGQNQFENLTEEEILFIKTIYGEANLCSEYSWRAIANIIMNRVGNGEWYKYNTVSEIIMYTGFDSYKERNQPFIEAEEYFENRDGTNLVMEEMIEIVIPIYRGRTEDVTGGATLYYSPKQQKKLHEKSPEKYSEIPNWDFSKLEEVIIDGTEEDDFKFYRYK